jgi:hypothetical protein
MQQVDEATETGNSTQHANSFQVPTGAPLHPREWFATHGKSTGNSSASMSILNASMASFSIGSSSRSITMDDYDTYVEPENNFSSSSDTSSSDTSDDTRSTKKRREKPKRIIDETQAIEPSANDILFVSRKRYCIFDKIMYSHTLWYNAPDRDEAVIRTRTQITFVFE